MSIEASDFTPRRTGATGAASARPRVLVAAPPQVVAAVARVVPACHAIEPDELSAERFGRGDVLVLAVDATQRWRAALQDATAAGGARVVLCCTVADEPLARAALESGAADYVLWPLDRDELEAALSLPDPIPADAACDATPVGEAPTQAEVARLSDVLRLVARGPRSVAEGLAALLAEVYGAAYACVEVDGVRAAFGEGASAPAAGHEQVAEVTRDGAVVGRIAVGGTAGAARSGTPLATYASLAGVLLTQAREHERLRQLAHTDALSGLCNRRQFEQLLQERFEHAAAARRHVTLFLFDIDDFKTYNDKYGHSAGDGLVREIGVLLRRCSRGQDVVARYGGDEFAVIFSEPDVPRVAGSRPPTDAMALAGRFSATIARHNFQCLGPDAPGPVTISGGLASHPWDARTPEELVAAADAALLAAKRTGKNRIVVAGRNAV